VGVGERVVRVCMCFRDGVCVRAFVCARVCVCMCVSVCSLMMLQRDRGGREERWGGVK
jgi:hypothetical protein